MRPSTLAFFSPARLLTLSFLGLITIGTILLSLQCCTPFSISLIDVFFVSTSIVTTTGLALIPVSSFTPLGQLVALILMQIGGLGVITLSLFLISLIFDLSIATQIFGARLLALDTWKGIRDLIIFIIQFSLLVELIGAFLIFLVIYKDFNVGHAIFLSIFHAVSAYTAAGISIFPGGMASYSTNILFLISVTAIMMAGEIGFIVWHELWDYIQTRFHGKRFHFSLHAKVVFYSFLFMSISSFLLYWILEHHNTLAIFPMPYNILNALFNSTAGRGIGFSSINVDSLQIATLLLIMVLTFVGASPGSTGSGVKTTTVTLLFSIVKAAVCSRSSVTLFGRTISRDQIYQAVSIVALSMSWICVILFLMLITEHATFLDILFEIVSAFGNCGLSTGITSSLSTIGKVCIALTMIVGRVGCLAIILSLSRKPTKREYQLPEERIMLG